MRSLLMAMVALSPIGALAQETIENPMYTAPPGEPLAGLRICVDAGHGGQTWGNTRGYTGGTRSAVSDTTESDVNLRVAMFLWDLLTQAGAEVVMTRTFETRLSEDCLEEPGTEAWQQSRTAELHIRCLVAQENECDLMVSVHHNAVGRPEPNFTTAFYFDPAQQEGSNFPPRSEETVAQARQLAEAVVARVSERLGTETRPARHGNFHVLRDSPLPVVLTEASFMTNPEEARRLDQLAHNRQEAIGIFEAVLDCYGESAMDDVEIAEEVSQ